MNPLRNPYYPVNPAGEFFSHLELPSSTWFLCARKYLQIEAQQTPIDSLLRNQSIAKVFMQQTIGKWFSEFVKEHNFTVDESLMLLIPESILQRESSEFNPIRDKFFQAIWQLGGVAALCSFRVSSTEKSQAQFTLNSLPQAAPAKLLELMELATHQQASTTHSIAVQNLIQPTDSQLLPLINEQCKLAQEISSLGSLPDNEVLVEEKRTELNEVKSKIENILYEFKPKMLELNARLKTLIAQEAEKIAEVSKGNNLKQGEAPPKNIAQALNKIDDYLKAIENPIKKLEIFAKFVHLSQWGLANYRNFEAPVTLKATLQSGDTGYYPQCNFYEDFPVIKQSLESKLEHIKVEVLIHITQNGWHDRQVDASNNIGLTLSQRVEALSLDIKLDEEATNIKSSLAQLEEEQEQKTSKNLGRYASWFVLPSLPTLPSFTWNALSCGLFSQCNRPRKGTEKERLLKAESDYQSIYKL